MLALQKLIPDVEVFLALSPEELGGKILFALRQIPRSENRGMFHVGSLSLEFDPKTYSDFQGYPANKIDSVKQAFFEAWSWLESQALIIWAQDNEGQQGWRRLSRRAEQFENVNDYAAFASGKYLNRQLLHPTIAHDVWLDFSRQDYGIAIFRAMRKVEIVVRKKSGLPDNVFGIDLMRKAFNPLNGPLADQKESTPKREATSALFAGAIGRFKNDESHSEGNVASAQEAIEIILLANHLLRLLDSRPSQSD